jgi:hypothetical protein
MATYYYEYVKKCIYDESGNKYDTLEKSCETCQKQLDSKTTRLSLCNDCQNYFCNKHFSKKGFVVKDMNHTEWLCTRCFVKWKDME